MPSPELVIFDCDGVLVDSERISHTVLQTMLAEMGVALTLQATLDHFMGASTQKCLDVVEALVGRKPHAEFMDNFSVRTFAAFTNELTAVPGVPELLTFLSTPFCVASNGPRAKMTFTLGHTGLLHRFANRIFSAEDVRRPKPAPDLFLYAASCLSVKPSACVVVEDSPTGIKAARAAGMRVLGYAAMTPSKRLEEAGADITFKKMSELPEILRESDA